jgi:hypothetical protein
MTTATHARCAVGLCALVLGAMAIAVSNAQAEVGAKWTVGGTDAGILKAQITIAKITTGKLILKTRIAGAEVKLTTSTTPELIGISLEGEGRLTTGGTLRVKGATTELNSKASAVCTPLGTAGNDPTLGVFTFNKVKSELVLHESTGVIQVKPEVGNVFGKFFFGEECSLPEEVPMITKKEGGKGLALTDLLGIGNELVEHEFTELPALSELWVISETAEHKKTVEGNLGVRLAGAHTGLKWKGTPG